MNEKTLISFDYAIKYLLKHKADYDIVEGFISAVISSCGYPPVTIKALLESASNKEDADLKSVIADLIVEDLSGVKYVVEIDRSYTNLFLHKACFNSSRLIVDSIYSNDDYSTIKKIININLAYFAFGDIKSPLHYGKTVFYQMDRDHPQNLHLANTGLKYFDINNIFPEYLVISLPLFDDEVKSELDEWLYMMKHSKVRDDFKSPYMKKVSERLNILKMTPEELDKYREYRNKVLKDRDYLVAAEEKGEARGEARGIEKGIEKGKIEIAHNMLEDKMSLETISKYSGLTIDEIKKLL